MLAYTNNPWRLRVDAQKQTEIVFERIGEALAEVGAELSNVIETRKFLRDISDWEPVGRVQGQVFCDVRPATTMVQAGALISDDLLVEIAVTVVKD